MIVEILKQTIDVLIEIADERAATKKFAFGEAKFKHRISSIQVLAREAFVFSCEMHKKKVFVRQEIPTNSAMLKMERGRIKVIR